MACGLRQQAVSASHCQETDMAPAPQERPLYLDYAATTPVDPRVAQAMWPWVVEKFGNPASRTHAWGWEADAAITAAREEVARLIGADPREIVFTSGATEGNNLALKGAAQFNAARGRHVVTVKTEHKSVLDAVRELERVGFSATYLDVLADGRVDLAALEAALRPDTTLVSVMLVNNETGVIQDVAAIGRLLRPRGILLHVDAVQAVGKLPVDVEALGCDLLTLSAHKIYGPKGIGALYVRRKPRVRIEPQMHGGGHERGLRSGTLPTHQIVGLGEACRLARLELATEVERVRALRDRLLAGLAAIEQTRVNGSLGARIAHNLNISFNFVEAEALMMGCKQLAVSSGSACTSASLEPSYVLRAMGLSDELAHSSIRFSLGRFSTVAEIDSAIAQVTRTVARLRAMSPLWDMHQAQIDLSTVRWAAH
jgi:cysteine desulfurase